MKFKSTLIPGSQKANEAVDIEKSIGLNPQSEKARPIFWNRLLKDFSSVRSPCAPLLLASSATVNPLGLASIARMMRH